MWMYAKSFRCNTAWGASPTFDLGDFAHGFFQQIQAKIQIIFYSIWLYRMKHGLLHTSLILTIVSYPWLNLTVVCMEIRIKVRSRCHKDRHKGETKEAFSVVMLDAPRFHSCYMKMVNYAYYAWPGRYMLSSVWYRYAQKASPIPYNIVCLSVAAR